MYWLVHRPLAPLARLRMKGGWLAARRIAKGQMRLERAAQQLALSRATTRHARCTVHVLTGARYWDQALFCLSSLRQHGAIDFELEVIDDGSLTPDQIACFRRQWPNMRLLDHGTAEARVDAALPRARFPRLRQLRDELVLTRKLVDVHAGKSGFNLVLDSDMLFHANPTDLIAWMESPQGIIVMRDCAESYGYPREFLEQEVLGTPLMARVNSGLVGMPSEEIQWSRLEAWVDRIWTLRGRHYFLEQTLVALWASAQSGRALDEHDYRVIGESFPGVEQRSALVHYVAQAKAQYMDRDWAALARKLSAP